MARPAAESDVYQMVQHDAALKPRPRVLLGSSARALIWLVAAAAATVALVHYYPDSYQQDGGTHFLFARWAWVHPDAFVNVWGRPLFTFLYSFPALLGYPAAKLLTVAISLVTAWQTFRLAQQYRLARSELAVPILFLQPVFLLISADTLTEPLLALIFVIALRLHLRGAVRRGAIAASLMILARPEGFILGILWAVWILVDRRDARPWWARIPSVALLAIGAAAWWLAALLITRDPLFILHNWPSNWSGATYGTGGFWDYGRRGWEILGPILQYLFLLGMAVLLLRRRAAELTSAVLTLFVAHSIMRVYGIFGSAGYPRYFVCVAPAMALITLAGWNAAASAIAAIAPQRRPGVARAIVAIASCVILLLSARSAALYVDAMGWSRDAWAVADTYAWFRAHPRPVNQLITSQAYMTILFDWDPRRSIALSGDRERNMELIRAAPPGTLVFWDRNTGPAWYGLGPSDFEAAGYTLLRSESYALRGRLSGRIWGSGGAPWIQEMTLLYR